MFGIKEFAFERFRRKNFDKIYKKLSTYYIDDYTMTYGEKPSIDKVYDFVKEQIDLAIERGVLNKHTFEIAPSLEIC